VRPDGDIDYGEIPPLADTFWKNAVRNPFYGLAKTSTIMCIDADVLHWLRSSGKGYQTRINHILWREMLLTIKSVGK
jgi:uncharacterized protein (DUF4415 family)